MPDATKESRSERESWVESMEWFLECWEADEQPKDKTEIEQMDPAELAKGKSNG